MGQRTAIILKKNFKDKSTINCMYHQWGIGKVMPSYFLQELLQANYNMDRQREYEWSRNDLEPLKDLFNFIPFNTNGEGTVIPKDTDIFNPLIAKKYFQSMDNNNGGMIIEVTQEYDRKRKPKTYGDMLDIKFSFMLGYEECDIYSEAHKESIEVEEPFSRLVSTEEYVCRTFRYRDREAQRYSKKFVKHFLGLCKFFGAREVYDKKICREVNFIWDRVETELNLINEEYEKTGILKPIPKNLVPKSLLYA